jgi:competence protein ComGC
VAIIHGLQQCQAAWTAATGKTGCPQIDYAIKAMAYCYKLMAEVDPSHLEELSEDAYVGADGRRMYDGSKTKIRRQR